MSVEGEITFQHSRQSPTIAALAAALAKAQGVIEGAKKDTEGQVGASKKKYADLASVWAACKTALAANGLAVVQVPAANESGAGVDTILVHSSGEWISGSLILPLQKRDAQGVGSAITYARRYALMAFVGIAPEDDDGEAAVQPAAKGQKPAATPPAKPAAAPQQKPAQPPGINDEAEVMKLAPEIHRHLAAADPPRTLEAGLKHVGAKLSSTFTNPPDEKGTAEALLGMFKGGAITIYQVRNLAAAAAKGGKKQGAA